MKNILMVKDSEKYAGKYVATKSFMNKEVITFGSDFNDVYDAAEKKGFKNPVVVFIPENNLIHIY
jgi:hypothetical protein